MKKFRLYLCAAAVCISFTPLSAQNISIGGRAGISIPNLTAGSGSSKTPTNTGYSSRIGGDFALFADIKFSKLFSLRPMLEYSSQGGKKDGYQAFNTPPEYVAAFPAGTAPKYLYADFKNESKLNYLLIPILANFGWNLPQQSNFRLYANAGPFVGFLLSAKQVTKGTSMIFMDPNGLIPVSQAPESFDEKTNVKSSLHHFNVGAEANVGVSYQLKKSNVFIEGGFNYGFANIQKGSENGKNHTGAGIVALGYSYQLSGK